MKKFYTCTGDFGETYLMHRVKVSKDDERIEVLGNIDELNSSLGIILAFSKNEKINSMINSIQKDLYYIGAEISDTKNKTKLIREENVRIIENFIEELIPYLPEIKFFVAPRGTVTASFIHFSRTICRRAERSLVKLSKKENINKILIKYLNRLSSFLWVLAIYSNKIEGVSEIEFKINKD